MSDAGQRIINGIKDAVAGNLTSVTIDGKVWRPVPTGCIVVHEKDLDVAHAVGFREGFRAACSGAPEGYKPPERS